MKSRVVAAPWVYETMATSHGERDKRWSPYAGPHVKEIADLMPQILTQMLERTVEVPSNRLQNAQFLGPE